MSFASVTKKPWSKVFSSDCNFSCAACKRPRFWRVFAKAQAASLWIRPTRVTAWLDWRRYCVFNAVLCFTKSLMRADPLLSACCAGDCAVFASASARAKNDRNTHVQRTRVLRKTLCVRGLGFAFVLGMDCVLESSLSVSFWLTVVRWLLIENLTLLGFCGVQSPFFSEDSFVLPSQIEVFFFVDHGIP